MENINKLQHRFELDTLYFICSLNGVNRLKLGCICISAASVSKKYGCHRITSKQAKLQSRKLNSAKYSGVFGCGQASLVGY